MEAECPKSTTMRGLCAQDIMSTSLISLEPEQSIGQLVEYLKTYPRHADFPVIDSSRGGILLGVVSINGSLRCYCNVFKLKLS